jgi:N-acetylmuramoyl-L-alanine amidase
MYHAVRVGSEIIVCGQRIDIEHPVRTFMDGDGYNAYNLFRTDDPKQKFPTHPAEGMMNRDARFRERRLLGRDKSIANLKRVVRQVVVHLDGCTSARLCFHVLHNQHGLSVHFMVDNDGTIYQTLDLVDCAFHAAGVNEISIGIELQNRGDAVRFPNSYKEERPTVLCNVHNQQFLAYDFTDAQYQAMVRLGQGLARVLDVPLSIPRGSDGAQIWTTIPDPRRFEGFIGHYHLTNEKWDPGPWDFQRMFRTIGSKVTLPLTSMPVEGAKKKIEDQADAYYDASEKNSTGHFPVGPLGESRLWHGGVHLPGRADAPIYAPIQGRVVAAKLTGPTSAGSANFVLMRHELESKRSLPFFSLYFHLRSESSGERETPPWLAKSMKAIDVLVQGRTALLDERVEAGELIGHVGVAGPVELRKPQLHFAVFAPEELGAIVDPGYWEVVLGTETNRFCHNKEIIDRIDRPFGGDPRDGLLSRRELQRFFSAEPARVEFRRMAVRHRSEWTPGNWQGELETAPDFAALPDATRRKMIEEQIEPTLWWTSHVAQHAGLPENGVVYSYHPIGFLVWYDELVAKQAKLRAAGIELASADTRVTGTERFALDFESTGQMTDREDLLVGPAGQKLTLEEMVDGYPE